MADGSTDAIPLDVPDVGAGGTERTQDQELIIEVVSTLTTTVCRRCGQAVSQCHGDDQPINRLHLPILGYLVSNHFRPECCRCPNGDDHPTTQRLSWYAPKALPTTADEQHLIASWANSIIGTFARRTSPATGSSSVRSSAR